MTKMFILRIQLKLSIYFYIKIRLKKCNILTSYKINFKVNYYELTHSLMSKYPTVLSTSPCHTTITVNDKFHNL